MRMWDMTSQKSHETQVGLKYLSKKYRLLNIFKRFLALYIFIKRMIYFYLTIKLLYDFIGFTNITYIYIINLFFIAIVLINFDLRKVKI
jgi:hypothetical protein